MNYLRGAVLTFFWVAPASAQVIPGHYIVQLSTPPAATAARAAGLKSGGAIQAAIADRRLQIRTEQAGVRQEIELRNGRVTGGVDTVLNALFVDIADADAPALASIPGVQRLYPVHVVHAMLDQALPLLHVPEAWARIGGSDKAGLGVKIAILDTGIDLTHPGFQDASLTPPSGFPIFSDTAGDNANQAFTNNKVIVARSYYSDANAQDRNGHGTAVAMCAAGVTHGALGTTLSGVAPKAFLGSYKIFSGAGGMGTDSVIINGIDDAVKDGMDIINLSLGDPLASRPGDDLLDQAIENAAAANVIVVAAAGNEGPNLNTITTPSTATSAIAAGAITQTGGLAVVGGLAPTPGTVAPVRIHPQPIYAPLVDAATPDPSGLACDTLPAGSLTGKIALVLRGTCTFEVKLNNAQAAGAAAVLFYTDAARPAAPDWSPGAATLPAVMLSNVDGVAVKQRLAEAPKTSARLVFDNSGVAQFSSRGPDSDLTVKPDVLAPGTVLTATQQNNPNGELYSSTGYVLISGTSFSAPLTAGAAAVVKAARPGLTAQQYRSLVVNSATPVVTGAPRRTQVQLAGAGLLNVDAALRDTAAVCVPAGSDCKLTSISWGSQTAPVSLSQSLNITNVGPTADTFTLTAVANNGPAPQIQNGTLSLNKGQTGTATVTISAANLGAGEFQGLIVINSSTAGTVARVPYWFAAPSNTPAAISILDAPTSGSAGSTKTITFRVTDAVGLPLSGLQPAVTVVSGGGSAGPVKDIDTTPGLDGIAIPGGYEGRVTLGAAAGANTFQITVGSAPPVSVSITGK